VGGRGFEGKQPSTPHMPVSTLSCSGMPARGGYTNSLPTSYMKLCRSSRRPEASAGQLVVDLLEAVSREQRGFGTMMGGIRVNFAFRIVMMRGPRTKDGLHITLLVLSLCTDCLCC